MSRIIVSRHKGAVEFLASQMGGRIEGDAVAVYTSLDGDALIAHREEIPVLAQASPEDVRGKVVYGNVPLSLAAEAEVVVAIEFDGQPPRGGEYTITDMREAGAHLSRYAVLALPEDVGKRDYLAQGGFSL